MGAAVGGARKYVYGLGLAYVVAGGSVEIVHPDRLGLIRAMTDGTGATSYAYDEANRLTSVLAEDLFGFAAGT